MLSSGTVSSFAVAAECSQYYNMKYDLTCGQVVLLGPGLYLMMISFSGNRPATDTVLYVLVLL